MPFRHVVAIVLLVHAGALFLQESARAQLPWIQVYQYRFLAQPRDIIGRPDGSFFAAGDNGAIFRRRDAISFWTLEHLETDSLDIRSIAMRDPLNGFLAGQRGLLFSTSDGGDTWDRVTGFTDEDLLTLHFWTNDSGLALSAQGGIWLTRDAGRSWILQYRADVDSLFDVVHLPGRRLLVVGEQGGVYRSPDDGGTWSRLNSFPKASYYGLAVNTDSSRVVLAGSGGQIWHSTDFGDHWRPEAWSHRWAITDIWFKDRKTLRVLTDPFIYNVEFDPYREEHTNGRANYCIGTEQPGVAQLLGGDGTSNSLCAGESEWKMPASIVMGRRCDILPDGTLCSWTDGTPSLYISVTPEGLLSNARAASYYAGDNKAQCYFAFHGRETGIMVQRTWRGERIFHGGGGWKSWVQIAERSSRPETRALICLSQQEVLACRGGLDRSTDCGRTWSTALTTASAMNCIAFSKDRRTGAAAGGNGYIYVTNDWGVHWEEYRAPSRCSFIEVEVKENTIAAIGAGGIVYVSDCYGEVWNEYALPVSGELTGVCIASSAAIFVCGENSTVFSRKKRGGVWTREPIPDGLSCTNIQLLNDGTLLLTTDKAPFFRPIEQSLLDVEIPAMTVPVALISLEAPYPQPARDMLHIPLSLGHGSVMRLELFDLLGRHRVTLYEGAVPAGRRTIDAHLPSVGSGTYILRARDSIGTASRVVRIQ